MINQVDSLPPLPMLVESLKQDWRAGGTPDAAAALREHPELLLDRSLVTDLVYEEYCLREEAGQAPHLETFCRQLPRYQSHIREVLRGHRLLLDNPDLLRNAPVWPKPGDQFEELVLLEELGRGAFAHVYLAREPETGDRLVVLKLTPTRSGEARTLGSISHASIVPVLWARRLEGFFAVCMPFRGKATLRDAIDDSFQPKVGARSGRTLLSAVTVPESASIPATTPPILTGRERYTDAIVEIASRLADAVHHLHRLGIAHGDLKPSNILLGPGGHPYLIDFNLATNQAEAVLLQGGTLPYMPPEALSTILGGEPEGVATASDVYSFGAVLFEAFTGIMPFNPGSATKPAEVAAELLRLQTELGTSPTRGTRIPRPLARLIDACLATEPAARPSMQQVKQRIDRYRNRHRWRRPAVLSSLIVAGVFGWFATPVAQPVAPSHSEPQQPAVRKKPATADEHFEQGVAYLKDNDITPAMSEFGTAHRLEPTGRNAAYLAFSYGSSQFPSGVQFYSEAITKGFAPAWVHNNLARAVLEARSLPENYRAALEHANKALELDPNMTAARLNRAMAWYRLRLAKTGDDIADAQVIADIEAGVQQQPNSMGFYVFAAQATVLFGGGREESQARAVGYLKRSVELGRKPTSFAKDPVLGLLAAREDFQQLSRITPGPNPTEPTTYLLAIPPLPPLK